MIQTIYALTLVWTMAAVCLSAPVRDEQGKVRIIYHVGDIVEHAYTNDAWHQQQNPINRPASIRNPNPANPADPTHNNPNSPPPHPISNRPNTNNSPPPTTSHLPNNNPTPTAQNPQPNTNPPFNTNPPILPLNPGLHLFHNQPQINHHDPQHRGQQFPQLNPPPPPPPNLTPANNQPSETGRSQQHPPPLNPPFGPHNSSHSAINPFHHHLAGGHGGTETGFPPPSPQFFPAATTNNNHNMHFNQQQTHGDGSEAGNNLHQQRPAPPPPAATPTVPTTTTTTSTTTTKPSTTSIITTTTTSTTTMATPSPRRMPMEIPIQQNHHVQQHVQHPGQPPVQQTVQQTPVQPESAHKSLESFLAMLEETKAPPGAVITRADDQRPSASVSVPQQLPSAQALVQSPGEATAAASAVARAPPKDWTVYDEHNQANQTAVLAQDHKYGYIVHGNNFKRFRVEEKTGSGVVHGLFGVHHNNGNFRGVQYSADSAEIHPKIIYDTLVKFLSL